MIKRVSYSLLLFFFSISVVLTGQENVLTPTNIFDLKFVAETSMSPDKKFIVYSVNETRPFSEGAGLDKRTLFLYNVADGVSTEINLDGKTAVSLGWKPDSKEITFRANMGDGKGMQVHALPVEGDDPYPLTEHSGAVSSYQLTPDGKNIVFVSSSQQDPIKKELLNRGFDAQFHDEEYRDLNLFIYNLETKETKQLTKNVSVFDFVVSPDGKYAAAAIADKNLVDDSYMFKRIHIVDLTTGTITKLIDNPGKLGQMSWSPDGKHLAFNSGVDIFDSVNGSLFIVSVPNNKEFTTLRNYSKDFRGSVIAVDWKDNNTVLFAAEEGVDIVLSEQKIDAEDRAILIKPEHVVFRNFSYVNGTIVFSGNTKDHPSELYTFEIESKELKRHTDSNPWLADIQLSKQVKHVFYARDGLDIEGVLLYPLNYEEGKNYPLIIYIHGGPEAAVQNGWTTSYGMWGNIATAKDYFVYMPNYRASSGRGVEFTKYGYGDLGGGEFDDILDAINHFAEKGYVDKNRVGIGGGSYGGYFSAWAATRHSEHFAAAVTFVGVSNQISKRFTTDIPYEDYYVHWGIWTYEDYELVYDRSPVKWATNNKTPTLILHGTEDPRVHPSQSLELYTALKIHGNAPVRLVWYPGEGHGNRKNTSKLDFITRTMEWFDYYLMSDNPKDQMPEKYIQFDVE